MPEPTYCADCAHRHQVGRSDAPYRWLCTKHPRLEGFGFVTKDKWDDMPPYLFCKDVNGGMCPLFEKDPGKQMKLGE